jgi:hypothetical protein
MKRWQNDFGGMNFLSEIREGLGISWAALRANKTRSASSSAFSPSR